MKLVDLPSTLVGDEKKVSFQGRKVTQKLHQEFYLVIVLYACKVLQVTNFSPMATFRVGRVQALPT